MQDLYWFEESIKQQLLYKCYGDVKVKKEASRLTAAILQGKISAFKAADEV